MLEQALGIGATGAADVARELAALSEARPPHSPGHLHFRASVLAGDSSCSAHGNVALLGSKPPNGTTQVRTEMTPWSCPA